MKLRLYGCGAGARAIPSLISYKTLFANVYYGESNAMTECYLNVYMDSKYQLALLSFFTAGESLLLRRPRRAR